MTVGTLPNSLITRCAWCDRYEIGDRWLTEADVVRGDAAGAVPLTSVDPLTPLHRAARADPADPAAVLLTAAEQLGSATRACELAVQHARTREQFGQPIGAFQAVKHLCARMLVRAYPSRRKSFSAAAQIRSRVAWAAARRLEAS